MERLHTAIRPRLPVSRPLRLRTAAVVLGIAALLPAGCGYQLALQGTPTPASTTGAPLSVRQVPGLPPVSASVAAQPDALALGTGQSAASAAVPAGVTATPASVQAVPVAPPAIVQAVPNRAAATPESIAAAAAAPREQAAPTVRSGSSAVAPTVAPPATGAATPMPSYTATAAPTAPRSSSSASAAQPPTRTATPAPSAGPTRPAVVQVYLPEGISDFLYVGPTQPVDRALAALTGQYNVVYYKPAGAAAQIAYRPGIDAPEMLPTNTLVRIGMKQAMSFVMQPAQ